MSSTTGSIAGIGAAPARVAGPGEATKVGRPAPDLDELGEDRQGDLLGRLPAEVEAGRRAQCREPLLGDPRPRRGARPEPRRRASARRRGRRTTRPGRARRPAPPRPRPPGVATTTAGATPGSRPAMSVPVTTRSAPGERVRVGDRIEDRDAPAGGRAERDQRAGDGCRPGHPQDRCGQMRFHVDLQRAPRMTGHDQLDDAVAAPALGRGVLRQAQQPWLTVDERAERLAHDDRLGAAAADPAFDGAVRVDDPRRAGARRGRPPDRHDGGDRERPARRLELGGAREDRARGHDPDVIPFSWRIAQTFWGVIGMSMLRTPRCQSASTTALAMAGGAPTVADSPTPLAPIG